MGRDKALVMFEGQPLVLRVAERLQRVADPVLLAPGKRGRLGPLPYEEVEDGVPDSGPLGGLIAGLTVCPTPLLAVVAVDMPFVSPELFAVLARLRGDEDAVVPRIGQDPEPLHAVYARTALPKLRAVLAGRRLAMRALLSELRVRWVDEEEWRTADSIGRFAVNLNRESDMSKRERPAG